MRTCSLILRRVASSPRFAPRVRPRAPRASPLALTLPRFFTAGFNVDSLEGYRKKLLWRCMERGMVENELLLKPWAQENMPLMDEVQLQEFEVFLDEPDPQVYKWLSGQLPFPEQYVNGPGKLAPRLLEYVRKLKNLDTSLKK